MQLAKFQRATGELVFGVLDQQQLRVISPTARPSVASLSDVLHAADSWTLVQELLAESTAVEPLTQGRLLAPVDRQEIWAAGVTYRRSKVAREEESEGAARFYDLVYSAARPELFLKATPERVVHPGQPVAIRSDSRWSVPEPELTLVISPAGKIVGYTIGNDMSARDIEGENPLYLPQAKIYQRACAVGPAITLAAAVPELEQMAIHLQITRAGSTVFEGRTQVTEITRPLTELVDWLFRDNSFPHGALLLTGTGIVPPEAFSLQTGDSIHIDITGLGCLDNPVG